MTRDKKLEPRQLLLSICMLFLGGCASIDGFPDPVIKPSDDLAQAQQYFSPGVLAEYVKQSGEAARRAYRDQIVYGRLHAYDIQYQVFLRALSRESGGTGMAGDLASLALNGLGATVGDAATKAALSAASAGVIGAQGAVSKDLFYQKTLPAVVAQMEAQRTQVRAIVEKGLSTADADYSLPQAIVDLDLYQIAGSLPGALNGIVQDAGTKTATAEADIRLSRDKTFATSLPEAVAIGNQIAALTDTQALALAKAMDPFLKTRPQGVQDFVNGIDPTGKRLKDGATAKTVLRQWSILDQRDSASQKQWTDAIATAGKN